MSIQNDEKILNLKELINNKRAELANLQSKFIPKTSCILNIDGEGYNLNVSSQNFDYLLVKINALIASAKSLSINPETVIVSGYSLVDWYDDILAKKNTVEYREKKRELNEIEKKLDSLLSSDKQTELQIDAIAELLKV